MNTPLPKHNTTHHHSHSIKIVTKPRHRSSRNRFLSISDGVVVVKCTSDPGPSPDAQLSLRKWVHPDHTWDEETDGYTNSGYEQRRGEHVACWEFCWCRVEEHDKSHPCVFVLVFQIRKKLTTDISRVGSLPEGAIDVNTALTNMLDSLTISQFKGLLESHFAVKLSDECLFRESTTVMKLSDIVKLGYAPDDTSTAGHSVGAGNHCSDTVVCSSRCKQGTGVPSRCGVCDPVARGS
jgi:hypothetical protein